MDILSNNDRDVRGVSTSSATSTWRGGGLPVRRGGRRGLDGGKVLCQLMYLTSMGEGIGISFPKCGMVLAPSQQSQRRSCVPPKKRERPHITAFQKVETV